MGKSTGSNPEGEGHNHSSGGEQSPALAKLTDPGKKKKINFLTRLRNYLLTGLIVVGPMAITLYGAWWFIEFVDGFVAPYFPDGYKPEAWVQNFFQNTFDVTLPEFKVPGLGMIFAILVLMIIGALTANLFGRTLISYGEHFLGRMPVVRNVYSALKQLFETVLTSSGNSFKQAGLIEYPRPGLYAVVFISKETSGEIGDMKEDIGDELLSVFLPTTPNPTSGFLLFVPRKSIKILDMSVEEAAKMVISAGLVEPGVEPPQPSKFPYYAHDDEEHYHPEPNKKAAE